MKIERRWIAISDKRDPSHVPNHPHPLGGREVIETVRKILGITTAQLAALIGVTDRNLYSWIVNNAIIPDDPMKKIAQLLENPPLLKRPPNHPEFRRIEPKNREILIDLIETRSNLTAGQIVRLLKERTNQSITPATVRRYRKMTPEERRQFSPQYLMAPSYRAILRRCCAESAPDYSIPIIQNLFTYYSDGQTIGPKAVRAMIHREFSRKSQKSKKGTHHESPKASRENFRD